MCILYRKGEKMRAKNRIWFNVETLKFDDEGFSKAMLIGEHGKVEHMTLDIPKKCIHVLVKYQVWEK